MKAQRTEASEAYKDRWGHHERDGSPRQKRVPIGHPLRAARRRRAAERQAEEAKRPMNDPRRKAVRLGRVKLAA